MWVHPTVIQIDVDDLPTISVFDSPDVISCQRNVHLRESHPTGGFFDLRPAPSGLRKAEPNESLIMRTKLSVLLVVSVIMMFALGLAVRAQEKSTAQAMHAVQGPIRTLRVEEAILSEKDGKLIGPRRLVRTVLFNEDGSSPEVCTYDEKGALGGRTVTKFESGREVEVLNYDGAGKLQRRGVTVYDGEGRIKDKATYNGDGSLRSKTVFTRDAQGRVTERAEYDANGSIMSRFLYSFDDTGRLKIAEHTSHWPDGALSRKDIHIVADRRIESVRYNRDGSIARTSVSVASEITEFGADGSLKTTTQITLPSRLPIRSMHQPDGTVRKDSEIADEVDAHGNWVKQTKWISDSQGAQPVKVTYRTITYY